MIWREVWRRNGRDRRTSATVGAFQVGPVLVSTLSFSSTGLHNDQDHDHDSDNDTFFFLSRCQASCSL